MKIISIFTFIFLLAAGITKGQEKEKEFFQKLEQLQDLNEDYQVKIYNTIQNYPQFTYEFIHDDGEIKNVVVKGIDKKDERKKVEILLLKFKENQVKMMNIPTRTGIYYSVEKQAEPKDSYEEFYDHVLNSIKYPDNTEQAGVSGTIHAKFVVDSKGNIPYITLIKDLKNEHGTYTENMVKEVKKAIKNTSGEWKAAKIDGQPVASYVMVPVNFDIDKTVPVMLDK